MSLTRRDFGKMAISTLPAAAALSVPGAALALPDSALALPDSKISGVQVGIITYSLRQGIAKPDLPAVIAKIGISSVELMSGDAEAMAGAPVVPAGRGGGGGGRGASGAAGASGAGRGAGGGGGGRAPMTPEQQAAQAAARQALTDWRAAATPATWQGVRKQFGDQGVNLQILCYNMGVNIADEEIDYAFRMAQAMGVRGISSSSTVAVAKRVAPFAAKYKIMWGGHGHNNITDPEQFGNEESFEKIMSFGDYIGANLDVGHYNQTGANAVAFIQRHHDRITNVHIKDSTKPTEPGTVSNKLTPWGEGDAPIREVLQLMRKERYTFPANIEFEYAIPAGSDAVTEVGKCLDYARSCLAL
jgi:sugar phosphate isomerase/epimerase